MVNEIRETALINFIEEATNYQTLRLIILDQASDSDVKFDFGEIQYVQNIKPEKLIIYTGKEKEFSAENWRKLAGIVSKFLKKHKIKQLLLPSDLIFTLSDSMTAFFEGLFLGLYSFDTFKNNNQAEIIEFICEISDPSLKDQISDTLKYCNVVNFCRELGQLPANVINPPSLAQICLDLSESNNLGIQIIDERQLSEIGANAILSVGKGSASQPRIIVIEYNPEMKKNINPVVLVGKAITFDTGGYSLKNVEGIKNMKLDKLGGVTVLGTILAAAKLNLPIHLISIICAAENMISDVAYRPDDIIQTLSGKTVEILSTDAEGRLVLADGLTYAQRNYNPDCIIDFATLTGGIVVALGKIRAGLFSNNKNLSDQLFASGETTNEKLWPMPLDDDYFEFIKGDDADLKNSGGREGHPIMGGIFLKQFIETDIPWAHIDIAGAASSNKAEYYQPKGANGFGIRLMINFLKEKF